MYKYLRWCPSFGVSWGRHQAAAITEARSCRYELAHVKHACLYSNARLARAVLTLLPSIDCNGKFAIACVGPHWFPRCHWCLFTITVSYFSTCFWRREPYVSVIDSPRIYRLSAVSAGRIRSLQRSTRLLQASAVRRGASPLTQKVWQTQRVSACLLLRC
jgi:hypothetical protein